MSDLDAKSTESDSKIAHYLRKYALLYSKCAKSLDLNVNPEEMNKELIRMARYKFIFYYYLINLKYFFFL